MTTHLSQHLTLAVVAMLLVSRHAAGLGGVSISNDACPDGVSEGESWSPVAIPGSDSPDPCMSCTCFGPGFTCSTCGLGVLEVQPGCHIAVEDPSAPYPDCCALKEVCP